MFGGRTLAGDLKCEADEIFNLLCGAKQQTSKQTNRFFDEGISAILRCFSDTFRDEGCDDIEETAVAPDDFLCLATDSEGAAVLWLLFPCSELLCFRTDCCFLARFIFIAFFACELERELALLEPEVLEYELELELDDEDEEENDEPEE